jgi:thiamine monophosphate synthase
MQLNKVYSDNFYFFTDYINEQICKDVVKFKNIAIIYNHSTIIDFKNFLAIKNFCKFKNIKFYILDNLKIAKKFNLDGLVLSHSNKNVSYLGGIIFKKNFQIIGKVHNQKEYYFKIKQNCKNIILSPIFKNRKYKNHQLLGIIKFNLLSKNWKENIYALGGINLSNLQNLQMTKIKGFGFNNLLKTPKIKKPVLFFTRERV